MPQLENTPDEMCPALAGNRSVPWQSPLIWSRFKGRANDLYSRLHERQDFNLPVKYCPLC